jgi:hypothetical protein
MNDIAFRPKSPRKASSPDIRAGFEQIGLRFNAGIE